MSPNRDGPWACAFPAAPLKCRAAIPSDVVSAGKTTLLVNLSIGGAAWHARCQRHDDP